MSVALAIAQLLEPRAHLLVRETFEIFSLLEHSGLRGKSGEAISHQDDSYRSLDEALAYAPSAHKTKFIIKRRNLETGTITLHFYTVRKKSRPENRHYDHVTRAVRDTYVEHLHDLIVNAAVTA